MDSTLLLILQVLIHCVAKANSFNFSTYPAFFNFGDSNSDTGGLAAGIAFPVKSPYGQTFFHKSTGRFSDGRLIIDFLMDAMDLPFLSPYLDSVGAPNFQIGCNFATGGSTIGQANAHSASPFSFEVQVAQFIRFKSRVLDLLEKGVELITDTKLPKFLPSENNFKQALYMFDIGQNDIDIAFYLRTEDQISALIPTLLDKFRSRIKRLYGKGARNFWIHNMGPLGCLPRIMATMGRNASRLDQLHCLDSHNTAAKLFNLQLHAMCVELQNQFRDAKVTYVDVYAIKSDLIMNYSRYGFKHPLAACCGFGGLALNYDTRIACGETKVLNGTMAKAVPCSNTSEYVYWDGNHYTETANHFVASRILCGEYVETLSPRI